MEAGANAAQCIEGNFYKNLIHVIIANQLQYLLDIFTSAPIIHPKHHPNTNIFV